MTNDEAMAFPIIFLVIIAAMIFLMLWLIPSDKGDKQ
jgi:hypothetical protein